MAADAPAPYIFMASAAMVLPGLMDSCRIRENMLVTVVISGLPY